MRALRPTAPKPHNAPVLSVRIVFMKVLLLASRYPWPPHSGDRLRTSIWLDALSGQATVALVSPGGDPPGAGPGFHAFAARPSLLKQAGRVARVAGSGLPWTTLLTAGHDWSGAIAQARAAFGPFDATVVILSRLDPWVRTQLEGRRVLDAIDSLARNTWERARESTWTRALWSYEAGRVARAEAEATRAYDRVVVVSEDEAAEMQAIAIPNGIPIQPMAEERPRRFDFAFWGRLSYFANLDAARLLIQEVWPAIRREAPGATFVLGGSNVPPKLASDARRAGITLVSPVPDMASFARDVKVALLPLRFGSGQSSKTMEAAEAGCAIAAMTQAMRGFEPLRPFATIADDPRSLAQAAVALLRDEPRRIEMGRQLRATVAQHYDRNLTCARLRAVIGLGEVAA
jgi:glycosyltransferase involved in cell wall biosynthesis